MRGTVSQREGVGGRIVKKNRKFPGEKKAPRRLIRRKEEKAAGRKKSREKNFLLFEKNGADQAHSPERRKGKSVLRRK